MRDSFDVGDWRVHRQLNQVQRGDEIRRLEPKVMDVLCLLARHADQVLSRQRIIETLWPDTFVGDEVLTYSIAELRRVLGDSARAPVYIQTIPRRGYRLIANVEGVEEGPSSRYEILERIGAGAMGEVYLAEDNILGRQVALKFVAETLADDDIACKRFLREAKSAAALDHPYICKVFDTGEMDNRQFIVMEYVQGETLKEKLASGLIDLEEARQISIEITEALAEAHQKGIVHRDLKPSNIMLTVNGHVKVMDFGLAKRSQSSQVSEKDADGTLTETGFVVGTPSYMSPEQIRGREADARSDIFSLGLILYEMLAGFHPFRRSTLADTASAILREEPSYLFEARGALPEPLRGVPSRALAKDPEERYGSADELLRDLRTLPGRPVRRSFWMIVAAMAMISTIALLLVTWSDRREAGILEPDSYPSLRSIAVLPLKNLSDDSGQEYFSDGLTDAVITELSKMRDLKVISRTSSMQYKGSGKSISQIAEELGVEALLDGTVQREGDTVRITAQLIDGRTESHLWANSYDRLLRSALQIQTEISQQIASALSVELSPEEKALLEEGAPVNPTAFDYYLKARGRYHRYTTEDNEAAIEMLEEAVKLDPNYAIAYAGLAEAHSQRAYISGFPSSSFDKAISLSRQAISLNPRLSEGHKALGLALIGKGWWSQALETYGKAVELDPNNFASVGNIAVIQDKRGELVQAMEGYRRAISLDPVRGILHCNAAMIHLWLGLDRIAEAGFREALRLEPGFPLAHYRLGILYLLTGEHSKAKEQSLSILAKAPKNLLGLQLGGEIGLWSGDFMEARTYYMEAASRSTPEANPEVRLALAKILWREDRRDDARRVLSELESAIRKSLDEGSESPELRHDLAAVYAIQGMEEEAFRWLKEAIDRGWVKVRRALIDPLWADYRDSEPFVSLMRNVERKLDDMRSTLEEEKLATGPNP